MSNPVTRKLEGHLTADEVFGLAADAGFNVGSAPMSVWANTNDFGTTTEWRSAILIKE